MGPKILLRETGETGTFSEISTTNLGFWGGGKGTQFKNQISHRLGATYTYASVLRPLHK